MDSTNTSDNVNGRLVSKPGIPSKATLGPGGHTVGAGGLLLAPRTAESVTMPLIVILHGAGGEANQALRYLHPYRRPGQSVACAQVAWRNMGCDSWRVWD